MMIILRMAFVLPILMFLQFSKANDLLCLLENGPQEALGLKTDSECKLKPGSLKFVPIQDPEKKSDENGYSIYGRHIKVVFEVEENSLVENCKIVQWIKGHSQNAQNGFVSNHQVHYGKKTVSTSANFWMIDSVDLDPSYTFNENCTKANITPHII